MIERLSISQAERTSWGMNDILTPSYMVFLQAEIDASHLDQLREKSRARQAGPPSYTSLVIRAAALTMQRNPDANRAILGLPFFKGLYQFKNVDISVAVEKSLPLLPGQAYAGTIKDTLKRNAMQITGDLQRLAKCDEKSDEKYRLFMRLLKYVPYPLNLFFINLPYYIPSLWAKYRGCACWVNAPSKAGADLVFTTWPWPITFSFGHVKKRPWVNETGELVVRPTMPLLMVFDRRIMGGGPAGRLLEQFKQILEKGDAELEGPYAADG